MNMEVRRQISIRVASRRLRKRCEHIASDVGQMKRFDGISRGHWGELFWITNQLRACISYLAVPALVLRAAYTQQQVKKQRVPREEE